MQNTIPNVSIRKSREKRNFSPFYSGLFLYESTKLHSIIVESCGSNLYSEVAPRHPWWLWDWLCFFWPSLWSVCLNSSVIVSKASATSPDLNRIDTRQSKPRDYHIHYLCSCKQHMILQTTLIVLLHLLRNLLKTMGYRALFNLVNVTLKWRQLSSWLVLAKLLQVVHIGRSHQDKLKLSCIMSVWKEANNQDLHQSCTFKATSWSYLIYHKCLTWIQPEYFVLTALSSQRG